MINDEKLKSLENILWKIWESNADSIPEKLRTKAKEKFFNLWRETTKLESFEVDEILIYLSLKLIIKQFQK